MPKKLDPAEITPESTAKLAAANAKLKALLAKMLAIKEELKKTLGNGKQK